MSKVNPHHIARVLLTCVIGLLLGAGVDQIFLRHVGHDQSWCLYAADLVLKGTPLDGKQIVEVNPPFIIWFSCIPVLVARLLHFSILDGFRFFFDAIAVASIASTTYLLRKLLCRESLALYSLVALQIIIAFWLIAKDSLGQREHFFVLLVTPYLVLAAARTGRNNFSALHFLVVGLFGGCAICLKPQHILVFVAVEILLAVKARSVRSLANPSVVGIVAVVATYAYIVYTYSLRYTRDVMPLLRDTYWALNHPYSTLISSSRSVAGTLLVSWVFFFLLRRSVPQVALAEIFGTAALGSYLAYLQQHKGWSYQLIPAGMFTVYFTCFIVISLIHYASKRYRLGASQSRSYGPRYLVAMIVLCVISSVADWRFGRRSDYSPAKKAYLASVYSRYPEGTAVGYIATEPWEMPLIIEQNKILGQRVNYFWMLPAILLAEDAKPAIGTTAKLRLPLQSLVAVQNQWMVEDLRRWKPSVIVIDQCGPDLCPALHRHHLTSILEWFSQNQEFAVEWRHYKTVEKQGDLEVFRRQP